MNIPRRRCRARSVLFPRDVDLITLSRPWMPEEFMKTPTRQLRYIQIMDHFSFAFFFLCLNADSLLSSFSHAFGLAFLGVCPLLFNHRKLELQGFCSHIKPWLLFLPIFGEVKRCHVGCPHTGWGVQGSGAVLVPLLSSAARWELLCCLPRSVKFPVNFHPLHTFPQRG